MLEQTALTAGPRLSWVHDLVFDIWPGTDYELIAMIVKPPKVEVPVEEAAAEAPEEPELIRKKKEAEEEGEEEAKKEEAPKAQEPKKEEKPR